MAKLLETMATPEMTAWPFLVSCNQVIDYHLLLAPPPLVQQETSFDLLGVVRGSIPPDERHYWQTATIAPFGQVALVYRSLWATEALLGKGEDKQLIDSSKRPIKMYEGLLFESPFSSPPVVTAEDFSRLHQYTEVVFRDFWKAGRAALLLQSAPPFRLAQLTRTNPALPLLKPEESQPPPPPLPLPEQDVTTPSDGSGANSGSAPVDGSATQQTGSRQHIMILIGALMALLIIGVAVLLINLYVRPTFFPTPTPTSIPTLTPTPIH